MRKAKRERIITKIKNEIGFKAGERFYRITPSYLDNLFKEISKAAKVYVIVEPNGSMPPFKVTNRWDIQNMIDYSGKYDILELHLDIWETEISVNFEDNAYNKYTIYFEI